MNTSSVGDVMSVRWFETARFWTKEIDTFDFGTMCRVHYPYQSLTDCRIRFSGTTPHEHHYTLSPGLRIEAAHLEFSTSPKRVETISQYSSRSSSSSRAISSLMIDSVLIRAVSTRCRSRSVAISRREAFHNADRILRTANGDHRP